MNNVEACLAEIDRAITQLGARGIQVFTNVAGKPLSAPEFRPIFQKMVAHDLPVWVHPMRGPKFADYASEKASEHEIWFSFGWPYETTACMTRLIYSGIFDELPTLKIISHHMGGMIPYFAGKIKLGFRQIFFGTTEDNPVAQESGLKKPPIDYFKMLYADTALGEEAPTQCGHAFFGTAPLPVRHRRAVRRRAGLPPHRQHAARGRGAGDIEGGAGGDILRQCEEIVEAVDAARRPHPEEPERSEASRRMAAIRTCSHASRRALARLLNEGRASCSA